MTNSREHDRIDAEMVRADPSNDPFAAAVRATRMPMLITDPHLPDNPIVFVNAAFSKLTGYSRDEILSNNCRFLQGQDTNRNDIDRIRIAIERREAIEVDLLNYKKNGERFWNRLLISPVFDAEGKLTYFFASQYDVTIERERLVALEGENAALTAERHANQQRLEFSEESLRLSTEAADIGTWDLDITTDVLTWSDRTRSMFGISPGVPVSMADFFAGLHPQDYERTNAAFASAIDPDKRATYDVEYRTIGKEDRRLRWVEAKGGALFDDAGRCVRALGTAIDITIRKQTEERLRQGEEELRELNATLEKQVQERTAAVRLYGDIVASSAAPICAFDTNFRLIAFNVAHSNEFYRIFGHRVRLGEVFPDLFPRDQGHVIRGFMARALTGETFTVTEEFGNPDLAKPAWEVSYSPLRDEKGQLIGAFHYAKDISDRLRAQSELTVTQEALRQSQKMEAVGQLTGGLAHDFNNLLAGISGSLELMQIRLQQGRFKEVERYMAAAQGAAKRAAALTHRLLAFSRRQTLDPKPTNVNRLALDIQEMIQRTVGPEIQIEVVGAAGVWPALVDPPQLENALLNLCINARDAMPDGGSIVIETANKWMDDRSARQHNMPEGQYLALSVTDTGTGMTPEVVARVFEPFFTTKPIGEGTGLGLSMIFGFAQQSGGQVRVYSEVDQGTTVTIYLPRHYGEVVDEDEANKAIMLPRSEQGETVLIVDDEPTVRMLIADILDDLGYVSIEAADSAAGLKVLQSDVRIDLLVSDVGLPGGMNGRQMADAARVARPDLKILFITGYAENALLGKGKLAPGMAVLTKPFAVEDMAARIRSMIEAPRAGLPGFPLKAQTGD